MLKLLTPRRGTRGFSLVEVLVFMVIITIVAGAFTVSAIAASRSQTAHKNTDIASQVSSGVLERAKSAPWNQLGFTDADAGYTSTYEGNETVTVDDVPSGDRILPVRQVKVKGVNVTLRTHITWLHKATPGPDDDPTNTYGTKRVTTIASWTDAGGAARTARYTVNRTAEPDEAVVDETVSDEPAAAIPSVPAPVASPTGQAGGADENGDDNAAEWQEPAPVDGETPGCPPMTVTAGYARATLSWTPYPGASYRVYIDDELRASPSVGSSNYTYVGLTTGIHRVRLDAVKGDKTSTGCTTRGVDVIAPPPMKCPTVAITTSLGTARLSWNAITAAASYEIYRDGVAVRSVPEGATSTTFTGLAPGNYSFKVTSKLMADESAGCAAQTVLVPAPIPDCPTLSVSTVVEEGALVYTFPQVASATEYRFYVNGTQVKALPHSGQVGSQATYKHAGQKPGTYTVKVDPVGLLGDERTNCGTQSVELEPNTPVCPTYTVLPETNGPLTFTIDKAKRVDTYSILVNGTVVTQIDKAAIPATRTIQPTAWGEKYGSGTVQVLGYNNTTGLTTEGCVTKLVAIKWPTVPACPTVSQFTAAVQGRTIFGDLQAMPSVSSSTIAVLRADGSTAWSTTLAQSGGSFTTPKVATGKYTVQVTVGNPSSNPRVCTPPIAVTMPPMEYSDTFSPWPTGTATAIQSTEVGAAPWNTSGTTWARSNGEARPTINATNPHPMLLIESQMNNVDITVPTARGGEAIYFRVADQNTVNAQGQTVAPKNWWRTRLWKRTVTEPYTTYVTEWLHIAYKTEHLWQPRRTENEYNDRAYLYTYYHHKTQNLWYWYTNWSDWSYYSFFCGSGVIPGNTATAQYQTSVVSTTGNGCGRNVSRIRIEQRTRSLQSGWVDLGGGDPSGNGTGWKPGQQQRVVDYSRTFQSWTAPPIADATYSGVVSNEIFGANYWATGPVDGGANDTPTNATRVVNDPNRGQYWSVAALQAQDLSVDSRPVETGRTWLTTQCAGCETRQVPRESTRDVTYHSIVVEKSVNGTVTAVSTYDLAAMPTDMRVTTNGNTITIRHNGTVQDGVITDTTHQAATRHGVGNVPIGDAPVGGHGINTFKLVEVVP